ncbi:major facilitator superfamily domain-containing protein [Mycena metata]|uniref:Major facilitator superfamily domain-containing protein n=1 Tax=Mycena metata TaxID=1033252 RepID=A0AAD7J823_9AGAR|nr:major facilitator superfamily domain-containing protein [Mycena metata]
MEPSPPTSSNSRKFWLVFAALLVSLFLAIMESYAVSTALPVIVEELHSNDFIWVASAYGIASTVLLPLSGGLAEIFGRRPVILSSLAFFAVGSIIGGAARNINMLIAARTVQGAGAGGVFALTQIILSDLVTLEERGKYNGLFGLAWAIGGGIGPVIGGSLASPSKWRWLFYLNAPIAGVAFTLVLFFLQVPTPPGNWKEKMLRIDLIGNLVIIAATCALAIALTWGGTLAPWSSPRVLAPLCLGVVGFGVFLFYEWCWAAYPVVPLQLMSNRTTMSGYIQITLAAFININLIYYLPVYYQACKDASPTASGIALFGLSFSTAPFSILAGISIGRTKYYRPQIWIAWSALMIGTGLLSGVTENTSRGTSIGFQVIAGIGIGILYSAAYFPVLAPLPVTSNSSALSFFVFIRTLAQIWGITVGGAVLQNVLQRRAPGSLPCISSSTGNLAYSIIPCVATLPEPFKSKVRAAFAEALRVVWRIMIGIAGAGLLCSLFMKSLPLHTTKDENWALQDRKKLDNLQA